ncbi:MAG: hypothetical protein RL404_2390, partial [Pseudomonadota bacterium]
AGALDVIAKPRLHLNDTPQTLSKLKSELTSKIRILSGVYVFRRRSMAPGPELKVSSTHVLPVPTDSMQVPEIVVIGASTGGPQALKAIFTALQWPLPFPIVCVQHIAEGFHEGLLRWLGDEIGRPVEIAKAGQQPRAGVIYFAPENHHLAFDSYRSFIFSDSPPLAGSRPASDVLFNSAAARFGRGVLGIVLSGMGCDGASGLKQIADAGGMTVAQDEASCVVYGMPRAAIEIGAARYQLAPADIAQLINQIKVTT